MIPGELARKIRRIEISTSKAVNDVLAGVYHSLFKGQGVEFDEVRQYSVGDDVRSIDWNVTARYGHPFVKRFVEERELTIVLLVDLSPSGGFGSVDTTKNETAAELCALLAFAAIKNNDKVGLITFTDKVELFVPAKKGSSHVLRLIRDVLHFRPKGSGTNIAAALRYLGRVVSKRSVVFLISDFQDNGFEGALRTTAKRHDLIALEVHDKRESSLPRGSLICLTDAENGETLVVDSSDVELLNAFSTRVAEKQAELYALLRRCNVDHLAIENGSDYLSDLVAFLKRRKRRIVKGAGLASGN
jgi:uncharacterized protein (DUF58 family)